MVSLFSTLLATIVLSAPFYAASPAQYGAVGRRAAHPAHARSSVLNDIAKKQISPSAKQQRCKAKTVATASHANLPEASSTHTTIIIEGGSNGKAGLSTKASVTTTVIPAPAANPTPTTTVQKSQATSTPAGSTSSSGGSPSGGLTATEQADFLSLHNSMRSQHGAAALTWSNNLANIAEGWADKCVFKHSGGTLGPYGENLAAGTGSYEVADAKTEWTNEISQYDPSNPVASHYTQIVWKGTQQVGCGLAPDCSGIFSSSYGPARYFVCEYFPAGNVEGEFGQNVQ